jgi:hypothetical protein
MKDLQVREGKARIADRKMHGFGKIIAKDKLVALLEAVIRSL